MGDPSEVVLEIEPPISFPESSVAQGADSSTDATIQFEERVTRELAPVRAHLREIDHVWVTFAVYAAPERIDGQQVARIAQASFPQHVVKLVSVEQPRRGLIRRLISTAKGRSA
jgi:hypothetical protein